MVGSPGGWWRHCALSWSGHRWRQVVRGNAEQYHAPRAARYNAGYLALGLAPVESMVAAVVAAAVV